MKHIKSKTIEIVYENNAGDYVERRVMSRDQAIALLERDNLVVEQILHDTGVECWFACQIGAAVTLQ